MLRASIVLGLCPAALAGVHTVDHQGQGDFLEIQPAVDAAVDGDVIRILRPATNAFRYPAFTIDGKGLSILGSSEPVNVTGVTVTRLSPGQTVDLSHLSIEAGLDIAENDGGVYVRNCALKLPSRAGNLVRSSRSVVFLQSWIYGTTGAQSTQSGVEGEPGSPALSIHASRVALFGCRVLAGGGGAGYADYYSTVVSNGGPGGAGIEVAESDVLLDAVEIEGGDGGSPYFFYGDDGYGGDGGAGILVHDDQSSVRRRDALVAGGEGGGGSPAGAPGAATDGPVTHAPGTPLRVAAPRFARLGDTVTLRVFGDPGIEIQWAHTEGLDWQDAGLRAGVRFGRSPSVRFSTGVIPACGEWITTFQLPPAGSGLTRPVTLQAAAIGPDDSFLLLEPIVLVPLEPADVPACGTRFYVDVDAPPGGDGLTWATAFNDLRQALRSQPDCAEYTSEYWVAEGTYYVAPPGSHPSVSTASFGLPSGGHVYGGFDGTETALHQRDPERHKVILSGDIDRNDDQGILTDNANRVVVSGYGLSETLNVRIDGVTVQAGKGGIHTGARIEVVNCTVRDCFSAGAVRLGGTSVRMVGCRVFGSATDGGIISPVGSGVDLSWFSLSRRSRAEFVDTLIVGNSGGPGLTIRASIAPSAADHPYLGFRAFVRGCTIVGNEADNGPGGLLGRNVVVQNSILWGNRGDSQLSIQDQQVQLVEDAELRHLCVEGLDGSLPGPGHIGLDPLFVDPLGPDGIAGTGDDDLNLAAGSPCIDAGSNPGLACDALDVDRDGDRNETQLIDLAGKRRLRDDPNAPDVGDGASPLVDLGALERIP